MFLEMIGANIIGYIIVLLFSLILMKILEDN